MKGHRLREFGVQGFIADTVRRSLGEQFGPAFFRRKLMLHNGIHTVASAPETTEERDAMAMATVITVTAMGWQRASRAHHRRAHKRRSRR